MPLSNSKRYCDGAIAARFARPISDSEPLILTVPGGPGLGSRYLDPFLAELSQKLEMNAAIIDLPNHGESLVSAADLPMSYERCLALVARATESIGTRCRELYLFGQSFGARLVFDLLAISDTNARAALLMGFPYVFANSESLLNKIGRLSLEAAQGVPDPEEAFQRNWAKILPLYTPKPLPRPVFDSLVGGTKWVGNERTLEVVPDIEPLAERLAHRSPVCPVAIFQGEFDEVVPDGNLERLKSLVPQASFFTLRGTGHFPMVESPEGTLNAICAYLKGVRPRD